MRSLAKNLWYCHLGATWNRVWVESQSVGFTYQKLNSFIVLNFSVTIYIQNILKWDMLLWHDMFLFSLYLSLYYSLNLISAATSFLTTCHHSYLTSFIKLFNNLLLKWNLVIISLNSQTYVVIYKVSLKFNYNLTKFDLNQTFKKLIKFCHYHLPSHFPTFFKLIIN